MHLVVRDCKSPRVECLLVAEFQQETCKETPWVQGKYFAERALTRVSWLWARMGQMEASAAVEEVHTDQAQD